MNKAYRGFLRLGEHGEGWDILFIGEEVVAELLKDDLEQYGHYVTVSYYTSEQENELNQVQEEYMKTLMGVSEAMFGHRYSEITGYLWTDEEWKVGGHDLIGLLGMEEGRFCHLSVEFHSEAPQLETPPK